MSAASEYARLKEEEIMDKTIEEALAQFEEIKNVVGRKRDQLQNLYFEIENLLNDMGDATEEFEEGKRCIQRGLDNLSQMV